MFLAVLTQPRSAGQKKPPVGKFLLVFGSGRVTYSDGRQRDEVIEFYRNWGAQTEADLLWLVFRRNCEGITWCGFEEREASVGQQQSFSFVSPKERHS